jgi:hypothetical protein
MVNPLENTKILLVRQGLWTYYFQQTIRFNKVYLSLKHKELTLVSLQAFCVRKT